MTAFVELLTLYTKSHHSGVSSVSCWVVVGVRTKAVPKAFCLHSANFHARGIEVAVGDQSCSFVRLALLQLHVEM